MKETINNGITALEQKTAEATDGWMDGLVDRWMDGQDK